MYNVFLINAIVYAITFGCIIYKERKLSLYVLIWLLNTVVAIAGYICTEAGYYYTTDKLLGYKVSVIPYICIYLTIFVMTSPIKKINPEKIDFDSFSSSRLLKYFVYLSLVLYVFVSILRIGETIFAVSVGLGEAYALGAVTGARLVHYDNIFLNFVSTTGATFCNIFLPIAEFYFISLLKKKRVNRIFCMAGMVIAFLPSILTPLSAGSKGGLFFAFFTIVFYYIICNHLLSRKNQRLVVMFGVFLLLAYVVGSFAIDSSRIEQRKENTTADATLLTYLGEPMPNVTYFFYDKVRWHPNGDRFFPELYDKKASQLKSLADRQYYWRNKTGVPIHMFCTFWGACYIEFSLLGSAIYILILVFLWNHFVLRKYSDICMMPLVYYYFNYFLLYGIFGHGFTGWEPHKWLIYLIIVCWIIKILTERKTIHKYRAKRWKYGPFI